MPTVTQPSLLWEYVCALFPDRKKTGLKQLLKYGSVRVNGRVVTLHRHPLKAGDTVDFLNEKDAFAERLKTEGKFGVVYEDEDILVAEKPSGLLTMATEKEKERTLYFQLTEYVRAKSPHGRGRVFIVHRLDREASGLVVFAKNEEAKNILQKNWGSAVKKYAAVVEGLPEEKEGTMESYLTEDKFRRVYSSRFPVPHSRPAITHYRVLRGNEEYSLLEVTLETGRKNQIRVQLSDLGHPIVGDKKYGAASDPLRRLALHATALSFVHPRTGQTKQFISNPPKAFGNYLTVGQ
ncbi:MAG: RluA family pseudouridine synthase [Candidatus Omnitrophica bacterium]|nr:RluA family pseudouridine synthase [Candidatus Omnitrophota bacterium]